jgi:hypothetical protein
MNPLKVAVLHGATRYNGIYEVRPDGVAVSSAYGSSVTKLGKKDDPKAVAEKALLEIVKGWRA